jgi:hypothetical protein
MTRMQTWSGVMVVLTLALALSACKSRAKRGCNDCAPPAPVCAQQPPIADYGTTDYGTTDYGTGDSGQSFPAVPPAPTIPSDPSVTQADLDAAHDRADLEAKRRGDAEAQVRAEQERLARAAADLDAANRLIEKMKNAPTGRRAPRPLWMNWS